MNQHDRMQKRRLLVQNVCGGAATYQVYYHLLYLIHNQLEKSETWQKFFPVSILDQGNIPQNCCQDSRNSAVKQIYMHCLNTINQKFLVTNGNLRLHVYLVLILPQLSSFPAYISKHKHIHVTSNISIPVWLSRSQLHWECSESTWPAHKIWRPESVALHLYPSPSSSPWCCQCCECETHDVHCSHSCLSHAHHSCSCHLQHSYMLSEPFHCK